MKQEEHTEDIYTSMNSVWPENNRWYDYTHKKIIEFVLASLQNRLDKSSTYLNAGSGGSVYDLPGICYHVDIAKNLIYKLPNHVVASIENLPFSNNTFHAEICVGSVLNYCDVFKSIQEIARTLKPEGYLVLEFERSNTGELWGTKEYGKSATVQKYEYMGHLHTLFLYSENLVIKILKENNLDVIKLLRFHNLSALVNRITGREEMSGQFARFDPLLMPISYLTAHNVILLCRKGL